MGVTYIDGRVKGPTGKQATVKFLVDSGVTYSVLPKAVWKKVGLKPQRRLSFVLPDGTTIERAVSEAFVFSRKVRRIRRSSWTRRETRRYWA